MRKMTIEGNTTPIDRRLVEIGMSRATLARLSGVPIRTLENWSNRAIKSPNVYQFYQVAKILGCSMEDLLEPELTGDGQGTQDSVELPGQCLNFFEWLRAETKTADTQSQDCKKAIRNARWEDGDMLQRTTATIQADSVLECLKKVGEAYKAYRAAGRG